MALGIYNPTASNIPTFQRSNTPTAHNPRSLIILAHHITLMDYEIKQKGKFKYVEEGTGDTLILLHGLFGALSNFQDLIEHFRTTHRVVIPLLPLFELNLLDTTVG